MCRLLNQSGLTALRIHAPLELSIYFNPGIEQLFRERRELIM
jgi:hypothetical protein